MRNLLRLGRLVLGTSVWMLVGAVCVGISTQQVAHAQGEAVSTNIQDYVANKLDDFSAVMKVVQYNEHAGAKINKDFGMIYKIKGDIKVRYKEENKMRIDGILGAAKATLIVNGTKQYVSIPSMGFKTTNDLGQAPGKRKTLLDVGLISEGYLAYTEAEFKRTQVIDGIQCAVFKISYRDKTLDTSHRMVWIDPKSKLTLKREEYTQTGKLVATYLYKEPKLVISGIWFPSSIEVINNEGEKAGVTAYTNVQVNQGLENSEFQL